MRGGAPMGIPATLKETRVAGPNRRKAPLNVVAPLFAVLAAVFPGVARVEPVHGFETGRHKGVPYSPCQAMPGDACRRPCRARARFRNGTPQGRPLQPAPGHARRRLSSPVSSPCTVSKRDATRASPTARARPCPATLVVARVEPVHGFETGRPRQAMPDVERDLVGRCCRRPCRARARFRNGTPQGRPLPARAEAMPGDACRRPCRACARFRNGTPAPGHARCRTGPCRGDACRRPCRARARFRNGTPQGRPLQPVPGHARRRLSSPVSQSCTPLGRDGTSPSPTARAKACPATPGAARAEPVHDFKTGRPRQAMPDVEQDLVGATLVVARVELAHDSETGHPRQAMPDVERDLVGATLVVARVEPVHGFETGRHKGVPYSPRAGGSSVNSLTAPPGARISSSVRVCCGTRVRKPRSAPR